MPPVSRLRRILPDVAIVAVTLACVLVLLLCARWGMGLDDEAYVHLRRATVRCEVESKKWRIVVAGFPPGAGDQERPLLALYPFQARGANPHEDYGRYGDILGWSGSAPQLLGFGYGKGTNGAGADWVVAVPFWFPAVASIAALAVARRAGKRRRAARVRLDDLCPACGYDLRATPDRCPECGREAETAAGGASR
jgi:hypothetical protein